MSEQNGTCGLTIEAAIEQTQQIIGSIRAGAVTPAQLGGLLRLAGGVLTATAGAVRMKMIPRLIVTGAAGVLEELAEALESGSLNLNAGA